MTRGTASAVPPGQKNARARRAFDVARRRAGAYLRALRSWVSLITASATFCGQGA